MGRNKMEKDFSEKLNRREISPSENAWDRLNAMLTVAEEKENKPKRNFGWLYIAAAIAGFLLIGTIYLSSTQELIDSRRDDVVFENGKKPSENQSNLTNQNQQILNPTDSSAIADASNPIVKDANSDHPKPIKQIQNIRKTSESQLAENTINHPEASGQNNQNQPIINQRTNSASNVVLANNRTADELLAVAQKSNPENSKTSVKVNAKNLLSQVDGELDQTFREKVINSVGKNYRNAKVALANRNNLEEENH
ncbi:hypothetical protein FNO01nite_01780 [Flavobacterium noncentrifugens]|uniref:Uncharacterized protein n=1 Tax=Flavobacterium noncentrifugens TaxID=1128970 RepID=A0A1G8RMS1_9FLAO|nr:hypothetical protein [Flavobacterium noncentrifugens]GEP49506.1 hypothetical protein FNO01nite_01780 [Flavobacterium noncentrifugens]SDJ18364.1 hypothetical protein SAMN04487935_0202 [Flavobacterium noncentrifugens]